jgi:hypothetical protein
MLAIAGAILINAACILMATNRDSTDIYMGQRLLIVIGTALLVADIFSRVRRSTRRAIDARHQRKK